MQTKKEKWESINSVASLVSFNYQQIAYFIFQRKTVMLFEEIELIEED